MRADRRRKVIAEVGRSHANGQTGLITPLFFLEGEELKPIENSRSEFPPDGTIFNASEQAKLSEKYNEKNAFFLAGYDQSRQWSEDDLDKVKFSTNNNTFDGWIEETIPLSISTIVRGKYPDILSENGFTATCSMYPQKNSFLRCISPNSKEVLIGPIDIVDGSVERTDDGFYEFEYRATKQEFRGEWSKLTDLPDCALLFPVDLIPNGSLVTTNGNEFLINAHLGNCLPFSVAEVIDLISTSQLVKWVSTLSRRNTSIAKSDVETFKKVIGGIEDNSLNPTLLAERIELLRSIPNLFSSIDNGSELVENYRSSKSDAAEKLLENYIKKNQSRLLEEHIGGIVDKAKKTALNEIQRIKEELSALQTKRDELLNQVDQAALTKGQERLESLNKEILIKREELKIVEELPGLRDEKIRLDEEIYNAKKVKDDIKDEIAQSAAKHKTNLLKWKLELEAITGNTREDKELDFLLPDFKQGIYEPIFGKTTNEKQLSVINNIHERMLNHGHRIPRILVATLLFSISQNLIVTLAGKPGAGKSSAITALAYALGLSNSESLNRLIRIQVQRGWSSDREILGFENKLTHQYEPDRYGLYRALQHMHKESASDEQLFVLLDEANLSPIEHYWSGFMGACDDVHSFKSPDGKLSLPTGARFIATVNSDHTTERFSPRFLDRSAVIYLTAPEIDWNETVNNNIDEYDDNGEKIFFSEQSYDPKELSDLFGRTRQADLTNDESRMLDELIKKVPSLAPQTRKANMIKHFVSQSRDVMGQVRSEHAALDIAISIFLLPLVSGQGNEFREQINSGYEFADDYGLIQTRSQLERILKSSYLDRFNFFS